jgi:hypothetical protein
VWPTGAAARNLQVVRGRVAPEEGTVPLLEERWDRDPGVISATSDDPDATKAFAEFADPRVTAIVIDPLHSNTRAHSFYRRLGFRPVGRQKFGEDDCLVHRLTRDDWEARRRR